ncbi:V-type ATP synthase subunit C [Clostridium bovifaecis]|uniref:V-type ATP synthase subunit C n=1 Tax=Clostridium bovifaecis TaxID=2184719 RepID=A0A6I6F5E1_9CLOT|nr:V-type ATP synthase subunit C [Clostridium bovifaecis]
MSNIDYVQAVPRIRSIENKMLDRAKVERLVDSSSAEEAFKILQETTYGALMSNVKRPEDYEVILSEELKRLYSFMYEIAPDKRLIDIMSLRYDYHNIKVILKGEALNKDFSELLIPVGTIRVSDLKTYIINKDYRDLSPIMREGIETSRKTFEDEKDPQKIDIILDRFMYKDMHFRAEALNESYLIKFVEMNIDLINIRTLVRVKKQNKPRKFLEEVLLENGKLDRENLVEMLNGTIENITNKLQNSDYIDVIKSGLEEYTQSKNLNVFEKLSDNFIMSFIRDAKYVSFGVEPLLAYIFAKENEIKVVRIIMVGKLNNINADVIRERLRDIYV